MDKIGLSQRIRKVEALIEHHRFEYDRQDRAATIIQRAWRSWLAEYLDGAAGIHIKFRLGGLKFPPSIYYKIFTHRPIVDLCASSPKDYAKLAAKKGQPQKEDCSGWYKRIENNGWRLLSTRIWKFADPLTTVDNVRVKEIQHCRLQKKQDMERKRKRRKIEWLKKMYFGESLQAKTLDPSATVLIQRVTQGLFNTLGDEGIDNVMEWEVDEVLKWTTALNYEEYIQQWKEIGTSSVSEGYQGFQFTERLYDSPELAHLPQTIKKIALSQGRRMNLIPKQPVPTNTPFN
ncbi:protein MFI isoform X2 [Hemicordylus capensis]|uniref:protein MFI isoform X2 n=1 Tax=Hemicordylus capensis TaxID=884348 RepID=UPI0023025BFD|nr:protein MFI isoform X2 [Hemicordylus capensis]